jgi:hypothetical protein
MDDGEHSAAKAQKAADEEGKPREATSRGKVDLCALMRREACFSPLFYYWE